MMKLPKGNEAAARKMQELVRQSSELCITPIRSPSKEAQYRVSKWSKLRGVYAMRGFKSD